MEATAIDVIQLGSGVPALFVHGDIAGAKVTWVRQRDLATGYKLLLMNRRGFGKSPDIERQDFQLDASDITDLLVEPSHLVGHSYGAIGALLAAARRPEAVLSLTVIEPPVFGLVRGRPDVEAYIEWVNGLLGQDLSEEEFLEEFLPTIRSSWHRKRQPLTWERRRSIRAQMRGLWPWDAEIPVDELRRSPFLKLIVSGGLSAPLNAVCDVLGRSIEAQRIALAGAGHNVAAVGEPFNELLRRFWAEAPTPFRRSHGNIGVIDDGTWRLLAPYDARFSSSFQSPCSGNHRIAPGELVGNLDLPGGRRIGVVSPAMGIVHDVRPSGPVQPGELLATISVDVTDS